MNLQMLSDIISVQTWDSFTPTQSELEKLIDKNKSDFDNYRLIFEHYITKMQQSDDHSLYTKEQTTNNLGDIIKSLNNANFNFFKKSCDKTVKDYVLQQSHDYQNADKSTQNIQSFYLQKIVTLLLDYGVAPTTDNITIIIRNIQALKNYTHQNQLPWVLSDKTLDNYLKTTHKNFEIE